MIRPAIPSRELLRSRRGFTLLELCIVLFIIVLLAGVAMPAMDSAFEEQSLRTDAHQLSLMVKTAVIQSGEQQQPFRLVLEGKELSLTSAGPAGEGDRAADNLGSATNDAAKRDDDADSGNQAVSYTLSNGLKLPDATKKDKWESLPAVTWLFQPQGLCPLPRVRLERGSAYLEMSFNALTGDVENESSYLP
jgi:prepilin-type N-terminal cleavage/methylation domain-containing protein